MLKRDWSSVAASTSLMAKRIIDDGRDGVEVGWPHRRGPRYSGVSSETAFARNSHPNITALSNADFRGERWGQSWILTHQSGRHHRFPLVTSLMSRQHNGLTRISPF
jgi:hypothetical protein